MSAKSYLLLLCLGFSITASFAQDSVIITASNKYRHPSLVKRILIGKNYRQIWAAPVKMKMFDITSEKGGLKPTELGGGFQTKSLKMKEKNGREWVLRTVDKDVTKAVPHFLRKTFAKTLVQDMISAADPYAPLTVGYLAKSIGVSAPDPELFYVPDDPAFKQYRKVFANTVCMLELSNPTPDDSHTKDTEELYKSLKESSRNFVDDTTLLKARLLDMLIADWDRHAGQWKWGIKEMGDRKMYYGIPRDRDQAFFLSTGLLVKVVRLFVLKHFVGFTDNLNKLNKLNGKSWEFDHRLLNRLSAEDWKRVITNFQQRVDDQLLTEAVNKMPPEVVRKNGDVILHKLKKRRDELLTAGMNYYSLISQEVRINGTEKNDIVTIKMNGDQLQVSLQNEDAKSPYYSRSFDASTTKKISLHLFDGADQFLVLKNVSSPIAISLDSGKGKDKFKIESNIHLNTDESTKKKMAEKEAGSN